MGGNDQHNGSCTDGLLLLQIPACLTTLGKTLKDNRSGYNYQFDGKSSNYG